MMLDFTGKVALVIGAGADGEGIGNGRAIAIALARQGAYVVAVDRELPRAEITRQMIADEGGAAEAQALDATDSAALKTLVDHITATRGQIDVLVNVVGLPVHGTVTEIAEEAWDRAFAVNLKSAMLAMKHVIPVMAAQGGGAIVNISSIASIRYLNVKYPSYYASKAAMNHLSRTTALDFAADNVRINTVLVGSVDTPHAQSAAQRFATSGPNAIDPETHRKQREARVPLGRLGTGWDAANATLFLASEEAGYITGAELVVDGGASVKC